MAKESQMVTFRLACERNPSLAARCKYFLTTYMFHFVCDWSDPVSQVLLEFFCLFHSILKCQTERLSPLLAVQYIFILF